MVHFIRVGLYHAEDSTSFGISLNSHLFRFRRGRKMTWCYCQAVALSRHAFTGASTFDLLRTGYTRVQFGRESQALVVLFERQATIPSTSQPTSPRCADGWCPYQFCARVSLPRKLTFFFPAFVRPRTLGFTLGLDDLFLCFCSSRPIVTRVVSCTWYRVLSVRSKATRPLVVTDALLERKKSYR